MDKRKMFQKMVFSSIIRRRSRVFIAIMAVAIGGTILSSLGAITIDVPQQMAREMRSAGANMIVVPQNDQTVLGDGELASVEKIIPASAIVGSARLEYQPVSINDQPFVAAGSDVQQLRSMNRFWYVDGQWPQRQRQVLVGKEVAQTVGAKVGDNISLLLLVDSSRSDSAGNSHGAKPTSELPTHDAARPGADHRTGKQLTADDMDHMDHMDHSGMNHGGHVIASPLQSQSSSASQARAQSKKASKPINTPSKPVDNQKKMDVTVTGILETGGSEDGFIYMGTQEMSELTGHPSAPSLAEYSIALEGEQVSQLADSITHNISDVKASSVKRLTHSDSGVLNMLRSLITVIAVVVLALTMIGVSTTMMAIVTERRTEIGLRKALGADSRSIIHEFLAEGLLLGLTGGIIGAAAGYGLAQLICTSIFHRTMGIHPMYALLTVILSVMIAAIACLIPVRRALDIDPVLVLRGE